MIAVGGLLVFSFVATWVFGREFADRTAFYLMARPVSRAAVVTAKLALVGAWCLALTCWLIGLSVIVGAALQLPAATPDLLARGVTWVAGAAALMVTALTPVAFVASAARGYLAPLGTALGLMVAAQVASVLGLGGVVPWAVPAVAAGLVAGESLAPVGVASVLLTGAAGVGATIAWWRSGDAGA